MIIFPNDIKEEKNNVLGPSSTDYPPFNDSQWTLFEADTASASGKGKRR